MSALLDFATQTPDHQDWYYHEMRKFCGVGSHFVAVQKFGKSIKI